MSEPQAAAALFPLAKADLCVKCGLCLPHCPTYLETGHEADSPRGRISLLQAFSTGVIAHSKNLQEHLDGCLGCRSCERICPAKVPYGELIDSGRALLVQAGHAPRLTRWMAPFLRHAPLRWLLRMMLVAARRCVPQGPRGSRWARWRSLLPPATANRAVGSFQAPAVATRVGLFRGCVGDIADRETLDAVSLLLQRCGLQLIDAVNQTCCGALQQHAGLPQSAQPLLRQNIVAFTDAEFITHAASGCGATLQEYGLLNIEGAAFARRVIDPHRLLLQHWPTNLRLRSSALRVAVHLPCTQTNVSGGNAAMLALLEKIPGLQILALNGKHGCCGAAGTYFLTQPVMADRLLDHKLDELAALRPDVVLSSNIGCSLHLSAGLRRRGLTVPVLHPLVFLAQQWPDA